MTTTDETQTPTTPTEDSTLRDPATIDQAPEQTVEEPQQERPEREAAKYRRQLREAEGERDTLRSSLAATQTALVTSLLAHEVRLPDQTDGNFTAKGNLVTLRNADDLFTLGGVTAEELFVDGALDTEKLHTTLADLSTRRPELFKFGHHPIPSQGDTPADKPKNLGSWADALHDIL